MENNKKIDQLQAEKDSLNKVFGYNGISFEQPKQVTDKYPAMMYPDIDTIMEDKDK
jgi:hypothetical protein